MKTGYFALFEDGTVDPLGYHDSAAQAEQFAPHALIVTAQDLKALCQKFNNALESQP